MLLRWFRLRSHSGPGYLKLPQMSQAKIGKPDFFPMNQKIETVSIFFPINALFGQLLSKNLRDFLHFHVMLKN